MKLRSNKTNNRLSEMLRLNLKDNKLNREMLNSTNRELRKRKKSKPDNRLHRELKHRLRLRLRPRHKLQKNRKGRQLLPKHKPTLQLSNSFKHSKLLNNTSSNNNSSNNNINYSSSSSSSKVNKDNLDPGQDHHNLISQGEE